MYYSIHVLWMEHLAYLHALYSGKNLNLLKLNELGWKYPHTEEPLLWAINKQYWYQGELMFEAKGANVYDAATIIFQPGKDNVELNPIDVKKNVEAQR